MTKSERATIEYVLALLHRAANGGLVTSDHPERISDHKTLERRLRDELARLLEGRSG